MAINSENHVHSFPLSAAGTSVPRLMIAPARFEPHATMADMRSQVRQQARKHTRQWLNQVWHTAGLPFSCQREDKVAQKTKCFEFNIIYTQQGQPFGFHPDIGPCGVSVSHSGIWYAIATAPQRTLGIDLQCYRHFGASARQWAFTAEECTQSMTFLCAAWAVREAFLKSHGTGLPHVLRTIDIDWQQQRVSDPTANLSERLFWLIHGLYWVCAICYGPESDAPEYERPELDITTLSTSVPFTVSSGRSI
ncbi:4'-phosphopantetheinyl transferase family protein [Vibrio rhizosphaerae]|uniref:4'-phosphopantetheinyl transferase superfamily protein n=1 Tax=Vibrio rhizosphaerae TaxID=398736 RepID=A0ABU4IUD0_9VIBR|nr:4'-phosphopantetheinyl transferase superfamily protein [Vibrio rhizosphaerae]MDW6092930.1 4'-phosphopantetheinyl transferase superfamily protein [Vibrio rhizosphaerae]